MFFKKLFKKKEGKGNPPPQQPPQPSPPPSEDDILVPPFYRISFVGYLSTFGKNFLSQFCEGHPSDSHRCGGDMFKTKRLKMPDGSTVTLSIWSVTGKKENFKGYAAPICLKAHSIVFHYNPSDRESFDNIKWSIEENRDFILSLNKPVQIVGFPLTESSENVIPQKEVDDLAEAVGAKTSTYYLSDRERAEDFFREIFTDISEAAAKVDNKDEKEVKIDGKPVEIPYDFMFRVKIVSYGKSGKTSLILRYSNDEFVESGYLSVGDFKIEDVPLRGGISVRLQVFDMPSGDFYVIKRTYLTSSEVIFICYDTTNPESFSEAKQWKREIDSYGREDIPIIIVGTKSDLPPAVDPVIAKEYTDSEKVPLMMCSSKTGEGVNEVFEKAIEMLGKKYKVKFELEKR